MSGFSYARVESGLAAALSVDTDVQRGPFRARLKHFARLGLPGIKAGKGARIEYTADQAHQWLIALLMSEIGIDPVVTVTVIDKYWDRFLAPWMKRATDKAAIATDNPNPVFLTLRPRLMSQGWTRKSRPEPEWIGAFRRYQDKGPAAGQETITITMNQNDDLWLCVRNLTAAMVKLQAVLEKD